MENEIKIEKDKKLLSFVILFSELNLCHLFLVGLELFVDVIFDCQERNFEGKVTDGG